MTDPDDRPRVPGVRRAAAVLDVVCGSDGPISLAGIARLTELPKSSVLGICSTLTLEGFLLRGEDGTYRPGPRLAQLGAVALAHRPIVAHVGVSMPSRTNPFFTAELAAIELEAAALQAQVLHAAAAGSVDVQARQLDELLDAGVELLLVDPVQTEGLEGVLARAARSSVPVVSMNGACRGADAAVTTDNTQAGFLAGRFVVDRLMRPAEVVIVDGTRVTAVTDRITGFLEAVASHPGVRVVARLTGDNTQETARASVSEYAHSAPAPDAIFAINDLSALGAAEASTAWAAPPIIVGVDGAARAIAQVRSGGPVVATVAQDPARIGRTAFRLGIELKAGSSRSQQTVLLPARLISAAQAADYESWG